MSAVSVSAGLRNYELPWTQSEEQERRYRRIRRRVLFVLLALSLVILWLPTPPLPKAALSSPAPIRIVLDQRPPPPALPPAPPAPVPKPDLAAVASPTPKPPPPKPLASETPQTVRDRTPGSAPPGPTARERAQAAGLGNLADDLASLRDSSVASKAITGRPDLKGAPNPNYTSDLNGGTDRGPGSERSLITAQAGVGSGGINTAALSRGTGGGGLAGRGTTQVEGYGGGGTGLGPGVGRGGHGNGGGGGGGNGTGTGSGSGSGSGSGGSRSREEIERVFDQNKGSIYALYNRALRATPDLQGKMVLRLTILPSGVVSACEVISSELHDAELEGHLVQRVLLFRFEARDVATVTTTKPIDFFPS